MRRDNVQVYDAFCGAGGSSSGAVRAGVEVVCAANHWDLAINTHQTNHPNTMHMLADLRQVHPSQIPWTLVAWFSPECTSHSLAKGRKRKNLTQKSMFDDTAYDPEEERSRATMREVVEHAAYHHNPIVIVENVVDVRHWQFYDDWLLAMANEGYEWRTLYLNAQFFDTPQSRDRWYTVFWRRGNRAPDLDFRPHAYCGACEALVGARQTWKNAGKGAWGRYRRQYVYTCPDCRREVEPFHTPAAAVIDWSLPITRIADRKKPLRAKTMERVRTGLKKFGRRVSVVETAFSHAPANRVRPADEPLPSQTTRATVALTMPPHIDVLRSSEPRTYGVDEPLTTIVASAAQHYLIAPPLMVMQRKNTLPTDATGEAMPTIVTGGYQHYLLTPQVVTLRQSAQYRGLGESLSTISAGGNNHALLMAYYGSNPVYADTDDAMPGITTRARHALVQPHGEPLTDADVDALLPECGFRMLQPGELKLGMGFDADYVLLGNKGQQVKLAGNAVVPNVAQWLIERCVAALEPGYGGH